MDLWRLTGQSAPETDTPRARGGFDGIRGAVCETLRGV